MELQHLRIFVYKPIPTASAERRINNLEQDLHILYIASKDNSLGEGLFMERLISRIEQSYSYFFLYSPKLNHFLK